MTAPAGPTAYRVSAADLVRRLRDPATRREIASLRPVSDRLSCVLRLMGVGCLVDPDTLGLVDAVQDLTLRVWGSDAPLEDEAPQGATLILLRAVWQALWLRDLDPWTRQDSAIIAHCPWCGRRTLVVRGCGCGWRCYGCHRRGSLESLAGDLGAVLEAAAW